MATKLRRTLFIGLGGTGMNALLHTKKILYDTYGEIPPMLGFLGIDTDGGVYNKSLPAKDGTPITLSSSEQLPISVNSPSAIYLRTPGNFDWIPACNTAALTSLNIGAGAIRTNGRFAVTIREDDVVNSLSSKLRQINSAAIIDNPRYGLLSNEVEVHLVFSLGGGTGCGTFLNMAYLIKRILPEAKLSGYAVMADVFRAMMHGAGMARVRPNAMGAIRDLDFLMHLGPGSLPVELKWLRSTEMVRERPFTAFYFIDNRNENNDMFSNVDQLCEMISLALVTSTGELSVATASVSDNVAKQINDGTMDIRNKKAWAAGFGVSEILFSSHTLSEIYTLKAIRQIINRMRNGGCDDPSVLANNWFTNTRIRENLEKDDVIDYFMPAASPRSLSEIESPENPKVEVDHFLANIATESPESLIEKLNALKSRVDIALSDFMKEQSNRECGIYLCEHILKAILTQIELCDGEMHTEMKGLEELLPRQESSLESTCKELSETRGIFSGGKRRELSAEVCDRTMTVARTRREITRRQMARDFYYWLRTRIGQSFDRVNIILSNLHAVDEECGRTIERKLLNIGNSNFFQVDLTGPEAEKITCPAQDIVFNDFIKFMSTDGGIQTISTMSAAETSRLFNDFASTLPKVKELKNTTIDQVIDAMDDDSFDRLCHRAVSKAMPLFTYSYRGYDSDIKDRPVDNFYVGVADKAKSRISRRDHLRNILPGSSSVDYSTTGISDRIIIYRQIGVVPAFTLTSLDNYILEYNRFEEDKEFTSHFDAEMARRMKRERFDLEPHDDISRSKVIALWTFAIVAGIIVRDPSKEAYIIRSRAMGGKPLNGYRVQLGASREEALSTLIDNLDIIAPEIEKERDKVGMPGEDTTMLDRLRRAKASVDDGTYLTDFSGCQYTIEQLEDPRLKATADILNEEMNYITDEF